MSLRGLASLNHSLPDSGDLDGDFVRHFDFSYDQRYDSAPCLAAIGGSCYLKDRVKSDERNPEFFRNFDLSTWHRKYEQIA